MVKKKYVSCLKYFFMTQIMTRSTVMFLFALSYLLPRHLWSLLSFRYSFPKTCKFVVLNVPEALNTSTLIYQYWVHDLNTISCKLVSLPGVSILINDVAIHPFPSWNTPSPSPASHHQMLPTCMNVFKLRFHWPLELPSPSEHVITLC